MFLVSHVRWSCDRKVVVSLQLEILRYDSAIDFEFLYIKLMNAVLIES